MATDESDRQLGAFTRQMVEKDLMAKFADKQPLRLMEKVLLVRMTRQCSLQDAVAFLKSTPGNYGDGLWEGEAP